MYKRVIDIKNRLDDANFLLGARQTGKSTLLKELFPGTVYYDLLNTDIRKRFQKNPELLREMLQNKPEGTLVIIDEIPKVPELLDEVKKVYISENPKSMQNHIKCSEIEDMEPVIIYCFVDLS